MVLHIGANTARVGGIILAGGASRRMAGRPKALLSVDGSTFAATIAGRLLDAGVGEVVLVAGRHAREIQAALLPRGTRVVVNEQWERGQLTSLQAGLRALQPRPPAVVVCLVDLPLVRAETYARLIQAWRLQAETLILTSHNGKHGHPVLLDRLFFDDVLGYPPEATMRAVFKDNADDCIDLPVDDPAILRDVDTPEDYEAVIGPV